MGVTLDGKGAAPAENPLIPNRVLREMYRKLVEGRLLEEHESKPGQKKPGLKRRAVRLNPHEAGRVSVTQGLGAGDQVMDSQAGALMKYLLGMKLAQALPAPEKKKGHNAIRKNARHKVKPASTRVLPFVEDAEARLFAALGAAMLQKQMKGTDLTAIFVAGGEVTPDVWRRALTLAAANRLPVIFVALPAKNHAEVKARERASAIALRCGLPGIPVDASDVVALYRVAQESVVRVRIGGGAVLIEGVLLPPYGRQEPETSDPIAQMSEVLLRRQAAANTWMSGVEKSFRRRLAAIRPA